MPRKEFVAKTEAKVSMIKDISQWLRVNCGRRWRATSIGAAPLNWRGFSKVNPQHLFFKDFDITILIHFKNPEDLMLYILRWPNTVLQK